MSKQTTVREACRRAHPLDGSDAQALEGALSITERERDDARARVAELEKIYDNARRREEELRGLIREAAKLAYRDGSSTLVASGDFDALTTAVGLAPTTGRKTGQEEERRPEPTGHPGADRAKGWRAKPDEDDPRIKARHIVDEQGRDIATFHGFECDENCLLVIEALLARPTHPEHAESCTYNRAAGEPDADYCNCHVSQRPTSSTKESHASVSNLVETDGTAMGRDASGQGGGPVAPSEARGVVDGVGRGVGSAGRVPAATAVDPRTTNPGSHNPNIPTSCRACGKALLLENLFVCDGCPCNSANGVNFAPMPCALCRVEHCTRPGHRLVAIFGEACAGSVVTADAARSDAPATDTPGAASSASRSASSTSVPVENAGDVRPNASATTASWTGQLAGTPPADPRLDKPAPEPPAFDYVVNASDDHTGDRAWLRWQLQSAWLAGRRACTDYPLPAQAAATDTAIRTLEYEAGARDQELADLRLRVVKLESAAGFVVRRAELATSESLRERIEALGRALDDAPCCLDCPHPVGFHDDQGRCTTPGCECPKLKDSRAEHPWLAPRSIAQVREELRRVHANNWHMTGHYEYARGYANGLHRAVSEIDNAIARNPLLAQQDELCRVARELIDAIAAPKGRDFRHAWEEACLRFCRFGDEPTLLAVLRAEEREVCALIVEQQASIRRMRAQSIADDSDRADGEAQSDDIAREESAADLLEYVAARVRQRTETALSPVVDWASMTAEQVHEAVQARPTVMGPWGKWTFSTGWSRHEMHPIAKDGASQHIGIQPSTPRRVWLVSGLGEYGTSIEAPTEGDAFRVANEGALAKGWKLMGPSVPTGSAAEEG